MFKMKTTNFQKEEFFYATPQSAGLDLRATESATIPPQELHMFSTGLYIEDLDEQLLSTIQSNLTNSLFSFRLIPELQIRPRSGLSAQKKLLLINTPATIDADYRGELYISLFNLSKTPVLIEKGDRIAQMICTLAIQLNDFPIKPDKRGTNGFGSSGVH
jgi:dUTP pyrophosphatase